MHEVKITGLNFVSHAKANKGGSVVLAFFDCQAGGFNLQGCAFVRTVRHGLTVWPPKLEGRDQMRRSITFSDEGLRATILHYAQAAFHAMGGTEGDWLTHDDPRREAAD